MGMKVLQGIAQNHQILEFGTHEEMRLNEIKRQNHQVRASLGQEINDLTSPHTRQLCSKCKKSAAAISLRRH